MTLFVMIQVQPLNLFNLIEKGEGEARGVQNGEQDDGHQGGRDRSAEDEDQRIYLKI